MCLVHPVWPPQGQRRLVAGHTQRDLGWASVRKRHLPPVVGEPHQNLEIRMSQFIRPGVVLTWYMARATLQPSRCNSSASSIRMAAVRGFFEERFKRRKTLPELSLPTGRRRHPGTSACCRRRRQQRKSVPSSSRAATRRLPSLNAHRVVEPDAKAGRHDGPWPSRFAYAFCNSEQGLASSDVLPIEQ